MAFRVLVFVALGTMVAPLVVTADQNLAIVFEKNATGTGAKCLASMVPGQAIRQAKRGETITWTFVSNCNGFNPKDVELQFSTELIGKTKKVKGTVFGTAKAKLTTDTGIADDGTKHTYKIYYDTEIAMDPELDINGQQLQPPGTKKKNAKK
jgi:hypothetical protein